MHIICDKQVLNDALSICLHAVSGKSMIEALEGVLITAGAKTVTITGYDMQMSIEKSFECQSIETGSCIINARIFFDIIRKMRGDEVDISVDHDLNAVISCGRSVFNIKAEDASEFPSLPEVSSKSGITLPSNTLRSMINDTIFAISTNENKPVHMGTLFETENGVLSLISVDGYRLAVRKEEIKGLDTSKTAGFVVPGTTLRELSRIMPDSDEEVTIYPEKRHGMFSFGSVTVITRLLEGEFLNYRTAVPGDMPICLQINKNELQEAVERVSLIISERLRNPVRCLFDGDNLNLSCITALGKSFDSIPIPFCPEKIEIGFNNKYLLDALKACPDGEVKLYLKSALSPCVLRPLEGESFLYLVLPVRLKAEEV